MLLVVEKKGGRGHLGRSPKSAHAFDPLTFHTSLTILITDALFYLKYLPLDTFYDKSQEGKIE